MNVTLQGMLLGYEISKIQDWFIYTFACLPFKHSFNRCESSLETRFGLSNLKTFPIYVISNASETINATRNVNSEMKLVGSIRETES